MARLTKLFCSEVGVTEEMLASTARHKAISDNRHILMWLIYKNTNQSYPAIGRKFGRRDHTSVLHAVRKINNSSSLLKRARLIEKAVLFAEFQEYSDNVGGEQ